LTVVQLLPALESGGVERSTLEICTALVEAGHRAIVVSAGGRLVPQLQAMGAEHVTLDIGRKAPATLRHVAALRRLFRETDIVRALAAAGVAGAVRAGMPAGERPRFVTTVHGLNSPSRYSAVMASWIADLRVAHRPRLRAGALSAHAAGPVAGDRTRHRRRFHALPIRILARAEAVAGHPGWAEPVRCCCCPDAARGWGPC
jgi:hypothetical protein